MIQYFQIADLTFSLEYDDENSPFAVIAETWKYLKGLFPGL